MISEYDLPCVDCDGSLVRRELAADDLGLDAGSTLPVAECENCGSHYYPTEALERIATEAS